MTDHETKDEKSVKAKIEILDRKITTLETQRDALQETLDCFRAERNRIRDEACKAALLATNPKLVAQKEIDGRIAAACRKAGHALVEVIYSCNDHLDYPEQVVDNLDQPATCTHLTTRCEIPLSGEVTFAQDADEFFGRDTSKAFRATATDPTWLDVAVLANAMIATTEDNHHVFLDGIYRRADGAFGFSMGS